MSAGDNEPHDDDLTGEELMDRALSYSFNIPSWVEKRPVGPPPWRQYLRAHRSLPPPVDYLARFEARWGATEIDDDIERAFIADVHLAHWEATHPNAPRWRALLARWGWL